MLTIQEQRTLWDRHGKKEGRYTEQEFGERMDMYADDWQQYERDCREDALDHE